MLRHFTHPNKGIRVPTFPDVQRTVLYGQVANVTVNTLSDRVDTRLALKRDVTFPLWGDTVPSKTTPACYQALWRGSTVPYSTTGVIAANTRIPIDDLEFATSRGGGTEGPGYFGTPSGTASMVAGTSHAVLALLADDPKPWLWVPIGSTLIAGAGLGGPLAAGSGQLTVRLEIETKITLADNTDISVFNLTNVTPQRSHGYGTLAHNNVTDLGYWARPKTVVFTAVDPDTILAAEERASVTLAVFAGVFTPTYSETNRLPNVSGAPVGAAAFLPLVNLAAERTYATGSAGLIIAGSRITGLSMKMENVTKVMNMEGTLRCLRYYERQDLSLGAPPATFAGFSEFDRYFGKASTGLYTAVRPSGKFEDMLSYGYDVALTTSGLTEHHPCLRLDPEDQIHSMIISDADPATASGFAITLRLALEFVSNDALLRPDVSRYGLEQLHKAIRDFAMIRPFSAASGSTPLSLVDGAQLGKSKSKRKGKKKGKKAKEQKEQPKPKPPAAKPKAEGQKKKAK